MYRAEVIGSMLRPSYLKEARAAFEQGELPAHDFKRVEDRAVDQVIAMQEGTGVDVVTDGEMRRFLFMGPITETVDGIELVEHDSAMPWSTPRATSSGPRRPR
jgi:5-methyltetrahydropteroyltriglutamate--homocysteine methyltransferase